MCHLKSYLQGFAYPELHQVQNSATVAGISNRVCIYMRMLTALLYRSTTGSPATTAHSKHLHPAVSTPSRQPTSCVGWAACALRCLLPFATGPRLPEPYRRRGQVEGAARRQRRRQRRLWAGRLGEYPGRRQPACAGLIHWNDRSVSRMKV